MSDLYNNEIKMIIVIKVRGRRRIVTIKMIVNNDMIFFAVVLFL